MQLKSFQNKKVFITGVSSGIGRSLAIKLVNQGCEVWGLARRKDLLEQLSNQLGEKFLFSVGDVSNTQEMKKIAQEMRTQGFTPDIVVLNAAVYIQDVKDTLEFETVATTMRANLDGPLFWISEFLPDFSKRGSGLFIGISSTSAYRPPKNFVAYSATKAGLSMAFRNLRLSIKNKNIRFSTIHFGPIDTTMWHGKKSFMVASPSNAARFVVSIFNKGSSSYFYPKLSTSLLRASAFLPDKIFVLLASLLRNKNGK